MTNPRHLARIEEAREYGEIAGREYQHLAEQVCPPQEWTEDARKRWCALLREIAKNPYSEDEYPYPDATEAENTHYYRTWYHAFTTGRHAVQSENRRAKATA